MEPETAAVQAPGIDAVTACGFRMPRAGQPQVALEQTIAARSHAQTGRRARWRIGADEFDDSTRRVAEEGRKRSADHVHALQRLQRNVRNLSLPVGHGRGN